jgi:hypothetical protein
VTADPKVNPRREIPKKTAPPKAGPKDKPKPPAKAPEKPKGKSEPFHPELPPPEETTVKVADLVLDAGTQMRPKIDDLVASDYNATLESGTPLPPITVFRGEDGTLWPVDGFTRIRAHNIGKHKNIRAHIYPGTLRDAIKYAVQANATHGLQRDFATKRRAVETLLDDPEWGKMSTRAIVEATKVHHDTVTKIRKDYEARHATKAEKRVAKDGRVRSATGKKKEAPATLQAETNGHVETQSLPTPATAQGAAQDATKAVPESTPATDKDWLETLPVREHLSPVCRSNFDRDALMYRRITESPEYVTFAKFLKPILALDLKSGGSNGALHHKFTVFMSIKHPRDAKVCVKCNGQGELPNSGGPCGACSGDGLRYS